LNQLQWVKQFFNDILIWVRNQSPRLTLNFLLTVD